ncbi:hypothetical protein HZH68_000339 [Vespula germanica]|uniref:Uncharacterized protein n=1 Tax=Vespula germanica TaxID=30212 RepID=A0A834NTF2_VESGE|nr:hypothetical protein HZH68_000339 [Vespula germanica]
MGLKRTVFDRIGRKKLNRIELIRTRSKNILTDRNSIQQSRFDTTPLCSVRIGSAWFSVTRFSPGWPGSTRPCSTQIQPGWFGSPNLGSDPFGSV